MSTHRSIIRLVAVLAAIIGSAFVLTGCARYHLFGKGLERPSQIAGEWVDVEKSAPADTSIWVLRADGYDGIAHVLISSNPPTVSRTQERYGTWYFDGILGDTAHQALCFSRRLGRSPTTCIPFVLDTIDGGSGRRPRLLLRGYHGEHHTGDRWLIAR